MKSVLAILFCVGVAFAIYDKRCMQEIDHGPCKGFEPRYGYNTQTGKCERFYFGGCLGNENNFESKKLCEKTCMKRRSVGPGILRRRGTIREVPSSPICSQPLIPGPCFGFLQRYGYDARTGRCVEFTYGGCGGNQNNFERMRECQFTCMVDVSK